MARNTHATTPAPEPTPDVPTFEPVLGVSPTLTREDLAGLAGNSERADAETKVGLAFRMRIAGDKGADLAPVVGRSVSGVQSWAQQGAAIVQTGEHAETAYAAISAVFNRYTSASARESVLGSLKDATPEQVAEAYRSAHAGIDWAAKSGKAGNGTGQVTTTKDPHAALVHLDGLAGKLAATTPAQWGKATPDDLRMVKSIRAHLTALSKVLADLPLASPSKATEDAAPVAVAS